MNFSDDELASIVEAMRDGFSVTVGGSRCHTDYYFREQKFWENYFDEGFTEAVEIDEQRLRAAIASNAREFVPALDVGRWRACEAATLAGEWAAIEGALDGLRAPDGLRTAELLRAIAVSDARPLSDELKTHIRECERSSTLYHAFMQGVRWRRSLVVCDRAIEWLARVEAALGERCDRTRASFESDRARLTSVRLP